MPATSDLFLRACYFATLTALAAGVCWGGWRSRRIRGIADGIMVLVVAGLAGLPFWIDADPAPAAAPAVALTFQQVAGGAFIQAQFAMVPAFFLLVTRRHPLRFNEAAPLPWGRSLWLAAAALALAWAGMWVLEQALHRWVLSMPVPEQSNQPMVQALLQSSDPRLRWAIILSAGLVAPVMEELMFRGGLFRLTAQLAGHRLALFTSASLFALTHGDAVLLAPLFLLGLALAWVFRATGRLLVPMAMHAVFNLINLWLIVR